MLSTMYLMMRSAHRARLEARTTSMQAVVHSFCQFLRTLECRNLGRQVHWPELLDPAFAQVILNHSFSGVEG